MLVAAVALVVGMLGASAASTGWPQEKGPALLAAELQPEDPSPGGQFVWILNRSARTADLSCWAVRSAATRTTLVIEPGLRVPAGAVANLTPPKAWLRSVDRLQLLDRTRHVVDETPKLRDSAYDDRVWFRGLGGDWRFGRTRVSQKVIAGHLADGKPSRC